MEGIALQEDTLSLEELIADANDCLRRTEHSSCDPDPFPIRRAPRKKKQSKLNKALLALATTLILLRETDLLLAGAVYGVMFVLAKGPSPTARNLFIRSVRETSAVGFLANLFYTEAEIQAAIDVAKAKFGADFADCQMLRLEFIDGKYQSDYEYYARRCAVDRVIVLESDYTTGPDVSPSLNANHTYHNWKWILIDDGSGWRVWTSGYG